MEADRQTLAESLAAAERRGGEEKLRFEDFQQQLKSAKAAAETAKQELQDYKHKASRILQVTSCVSLYLNNKYTKDGDCFFCLSSIVMLLLTKFLYVSLVQRETNQQSEGGIWSGFTGWQWDYDDGAGGSAA